MDARKAQMRKDFGKAVVKLPTDDRRSLPSYQSDRGMVQLARGARKRQIAPPC